MDLVYAGSTPRGLVVLPAETEPIENHLSGEKVDFSDEYYGSGQSLYTKRELTSSQLLYHQNHIQSQFLLDFIPEKPSGVPKKTKIHIILKKFSNFFYVIGARDLNSLQNSSLFLSSAAHFHTIASIHVVG